MKFGPQTGANKGKKEFKEMTRTRGLGTGAHWQAEKKMDKKALKKLRAQEAREARREAKRNGEKTSFFW